MNRRNQATRSTHVRNRGGNRTGGNGAKSSSGKFIAIFAVVAVVAVGIIAYKFLTGGGYRFQRSHLESYLEHTAEPHALLATNGSDVYFDMSGGMNFAYSSPQSKEMLKSLINKLAGGKNSFYRLAQLQITPLNMPHTDLYNYLLNSENYKIQMAPIEKTLDAINESGRPAVLVTDYEEYKGKVIERAAYAKRMFTEWLAKGFDIYFYKWDFIENGKEKHLFVTVFDDASAQLNKQVEQALCDVDPAISRFVVAGRGFEYPMVPEDAPGRRAYPTPVQGGNYHDGNKIDNVSNVLEDGTSEAYARFEPQRAEYYPLGVDWQNAYQNAQNFSAEEISASDRYNHFLSGLYVDFSAQNGYHIERVALHTTDVDSVMQDWGMNGAVGNLSAPDVKMLLNVSLEAAKNPQLKGWKEIVVDFDKNFTTPANPNALIRAEVVIASADVNRDQIEEFFAWPGNPSLAESVKLALQEHTSSPVGRVIYTYYIKVI